MSADEYPYPAEKLVADAVYVLSVVYTRKRRPPVPFWSEVGSAFGLGSGSAMRLCRACGYDRDTGRPPDAPEPRP